MVWNKLLELGMKRYILIWLHVVSDTNQETRASAQSGCLGARVRLPTQWGGLSLWEVNWKKQRGTTLFFFKLQGSSLMHWLDSRMRSGILATRNNVSPHKIHLALRSPNSRGAQDQGHSASAKLSGATSTWEMRSQHSVLHTIHHNINVKGRY